MFHIFNYFLLFFNETFDISELPSICSNIIYIDLQSLGYMYESGFIHFMSCIVSLLTGYHLEKIGGYDNPLGLLKMNVVEGNSKV